MADYLINYFSDDEESEWLANIDPSLLVKSNEEKQLDDSEIFRANSAFPSCLKPLYQSEAWCTTIHMKMSLIYM